MKKIYCVPARYIFKGTFKVEAENSEEAKEKILKHCGMVMGSGIQTTLPNHEVDWKFCNHPLQAGGQNKQGEVRRGWAYLRGMPGYAWQKFGQRSQSAARLGDICSLE